MKKKFTFLLAISCLILINAFAQERYSLYGFKLQNHDTTIYVGDTLLIKATVKTQDSIITNPNFNLTIRPEYLGTFTGKIFKAVKPGWGYIIANYNGKIDQCRINVLDSTANDKNEGDENDGLTTEKGHKDSLLCLGNKMRILPKDTMVTVGSSIQYQAQILKDSVWVNTAVKWSLKGAGEMNKFGREENEDAIGTISADGRLDVTKSGIAFVIAKGDSGVVLTRIIAIKGAPTDTVGMNTIHILRVMPNGKILPEKTIREGQKFTIDGIPAPLNIFNGAKIYFPVGSLHEDITLQIKMPTFARVDSTGANVSFGGKRKILTGIAFEVYVNKQHISPYYFDTPLNVTIPFKRGLMKKMNIDIAKLSVFFAKDSLTLDSAGLDNIVLDTASNQIFANVAHFSNLAVAESDGILSEKTATLPGSALFYPNPAEGNVTIDFRKLDATPVRIVICNLLGQTVLSKEVNSLQETIDLSRLRTGMYQLQAFDSSKRLVYKGKLLKK